MIDQGIKSRPRYERLRIDTSGRRSLIVADGDTIPLDCLADGVDPALFDERWTNAGHSSAIPAPDPAMVDHRFRSRQHLLIALRRRLADERMGFRLYAIGVEPFLWEVNALAEAFGMGRSEVFLHARGSAARRVFCNHCRTITEGVRTNIVTCSGCSAHLFVRDHFSRRLNAFAGVQVDAEVPGEIPAIEELYR